MDFLSLLRIQLIRSRGWFLVLAVLLSLVVTDMRRFFDESYAGSSWFWIGGAARALTAAFPFGVAFATWYAGRAHRNRLQEVEVSFRWFGLGSHLAAVSTLIVVLIVTVLPIFGYVSVRTWRNSEIVTGSPPDGPYPWLQIAVILFAFSAFMIWGYCFGAMIASPLAPLVSAGVMFMLLQVPQRTLLEGDSVSPFGAVIPTQINYEMAPYIGDRVFLPLALWGIAWFAALGIVPLLVLKDRGRIRKRTVLQTSASVILAVICAVNVSASLNAAGSWHGQNRPLVCIEQSTSRYCAPPGSMSTTDLEEVAYYYDLLIPSWFASDHMPELLSIPIDGDQLPENAVSMANFQHPQERNPHAQLRALLLIFAGTGVTELEPTAAQLLVACAMLLSTDNDCGPSYPVADHQFVPNAGGSIEGQRILVPFFESGLQPTEEEALQLEADLGNLQALMQQKLDSFMALSDEEKTAWLDENWDRLSSGELTLDDMP